MPEKKEEKPPPEQPEPPIVVKVEMYKRPQIAPDGHVNLSQEDIDARL